MKKVLALILFASWLGFATENPLSSATYVKHACPSCGADSSYSWNDSTYQCRKCCVYFFEGQLSKRLEPYSPLEVLRVFAFDDNLQAASYGKKIIYESYLSIEGIVARLESMTEKQRQSAKIIYGQKNALNGGENRYWIIYDITKK